MTAMVLTVMMASLLGSVHCAGMCGPFCAVAVGGGSTAKHEYLPHLAYHLGRLSTYSLLGAVAGAVGSLVDMASALAGLQPIALGLAGGIMVLLGLVELAKLSRFRSLVPVSYTPRALTNLLRRGQRFAANRRGVPRALTIGLLTTFLPCGWLYAFVVVAAGSGSPTSGALIMAAFWAGTVPVLLSLGVGVRSLSALLGSRLPAVTAVALVAVGLVTLSGRMSLSAETLTATVAADAAKTESALPDATQPPPCCRAREASE